MHTELQKKIETGVNPRTDAKIRDGTGLPRNSE